MKEGRTIREVAEVLDAQRKTKRDFTAPHGALSYSAAADALSLGEAGAYPMTRLAHEQLADKIDIPLKYYRMLKEEQPELLETNVNQRLAKTGEQRRLVRTLDGRVRAVLGNKYRPLDHVDMIEAVMPALEKAGCKIESCEITDTKLYLKAVAHNVEFVLPGETTQAAAQRLKDSRHDPRDDVFAAGLVVSNSEVGLGNINIEPLIWRRVCSNAAIITEAAFKKMHVGRAAGVGGEAAYEFFRDETRLADDRALWLKVRDCVEHVFDNVNFEAIVKRMETARADAITVEPVQFIENVAQELVLSQPERTSVLTHLLRDGDMSRFGLMNAVTRASQDIEDYDRATELERLGGRVLELPQRDWKKIATVH